MISRDWRRGFSRDRAQHIPVSKWMMQQSYLRNIVYASFGALFFSFYIILDTQLIIGGKHSKFRRGVLFDEERNLQTSRDHPALSK